MAKNGVRELLPLALLVLSLARMLAQGVGALTHRTEQRSCLGLKE